MLRTPFMKRPPQSKAEHLRRLVSGKNYWSEPLPEEAKAKGFKGWHERGYLPHCDKPGLIQFVTFRLWDSLPASRRGEWEHLLAITERSDAPRSGLSGDAPLAGARSIAPHEPTKAEARARPPASNVANSKNTWTATTANVSSATHASLSSWKTPCASIMVSGLTCWPGS